MTAAGLTTLETVLVGLVGYFALFLMAGGWLARRAKPLPVPTRKNRCEWVVDLDDRRRQRADERRAAEALRARSGQVEHVVPRTPRDAA